MASRDIFQGAPPLKTQGEINVRVATDSIFCASEKIPTPAFTSMIADSHDP
jgi:hypothetical protein